MKYSYSITIKDSKGVNVRVHIVATDRSKAEAKACELAGVPLGTEPENCLRLTPVDAVVD